MKNVGAYEAKTHLPRLLSEVEQGDSVTITKHGRPVARIVPVHSVRSESAQELLDELQSARQGRRLGSRVADVIAEGRR